MGPGVKAVFDSCILIDYLKGIEEARVEIRSATESFISVVSWIEVLAGARTTDQEDQARAFLRRFEVVDLDRNLADLATSERRNRRLRLPDAVILATAERVGGVLVTRNTKDFDLTHPRVRVPYTL